MPNKLIISNPMSLNVLFIIFCLVLFTIPLWVVDSLILNILIYTFLFAFYAGSWSIIGKYAGQTSVGHAAYFGLGAYMSVWLSIYYGISPWFGMFVGGVTAALLAFLIGLVSFKLGGLFYIFATIGFAEVVRIAFLHPLMGLSGGEEGIPFSLGRTSLYYFQFVERWPYYFIALVMMLIVIFILKKIENSKIGYYLLAIREDQEAAESIGIDVYKYKLIAASMSGFLSALAGTFYVHFLGYIGVNDVLGIMVSIQPVIISWIGGAGAFGPIVGSFLLTPTTMYLVLILGGGARGLHTFIYAVMLIVIVMFLPEGVTGPLYRKVYSPFRERLETLKQRMSK